MSVGEYVSVCSQADAEDALTKETEEKIKRDPKAVVRTIAKGLKIRGVEPKVAQATAEQLYAKEGSKAYLQEDLGIESYTRAALFRPLGPQR